MFVFTKAAAISPATKWTLQRISSAGNWSPLFTQRKTAQGQYKASVAANTSYFWAHWSLGGVGGDAPLCWGCRQPELLCQECWEVEHPACERPETGYPLGDSLAHVQLLAANFRYNQLSITYRELKWSWLPPALLAMVQCCRGWCRGQAALALLGMLAAAAEKPTLAFPKAEGSKFAHQVLSTGTVSSLL